MIYYIGIWSNNPEIHPVNIRNNKDKITKVIISSLNDIMYTNIGGNNTVLDECLNLCKEYNIPVVMMTMFSEKYNVKLKDFSEFNNFKKIEWPTYWFTKTFISMISEKNKNLNFDILNHSVNLDTSFDYAFINLNHLAKKHRCQLIDLLYKNNLFEHGAISWRDNKSYYQFKYWKPQILLLDHFEEIGHLVSQSILPKQYNQCFMQVLTESDEDFFEISEKTCVPLLLNKPFLVVGCKNFHNNLKDLGFKLYDEIFDYSFDSYDSLFLRTEAVIKNLLRIKNIQDKKKLFESVKEKILYNRRIALEMSIINIPDDILSIVQELIDSNIHEDVTYYVTTAKHYQHLLD